jgi:hypothetical protein
MDDKQLNCRSFQSDLTDFQSTLERWRNSAIPTDRIKHFGVITKPLIAQRMHDRAVLFAQDSYGLVGIGKA